MNAEELRARQAPLKERYRENPASAQWVLKAHGELDQAGLTCQITTGHSRPLAGLHPAAGGDAGTACSGDMLLEALVACAGVTLTAVATALGVKLQRAAVYAEGDADFRGTLGVSKEACVGFSAIRLRFDIESDATPAQLDSLLKLTERYCVIYQTLRNPPHIQIETVR
jgi:uncharacterized OsmC-like protein